jgi:methylenetetrahydrofolate dehydrogenase (NADP+)/methenyltetrahydrofolate cyclohydrolase
MIYIFKGREFAKRKEKELANEIKKLKKIGIKPKLVSLLVGDNKGSELYLSLKKNAAEIIGASVEIHKIPKDVKLNKIVDLITNLNEDKTVHGVMIQLPLPKAFSEKDKSMLIQLIKPQKDVDGLRNNSIYITPVAKAVIAAFKKASETIQFPENAEICVVGSRGFEGSKIMKIFEDMDYLVIGADRSMPGYKKQIKSADVLVSATGAAGLINKSMVKEGVVAIDIGSPKGDFDGSVYEKAVFITPVPGGIGPMTISFLMENLVESASD